MHERTYSVGLVGTGYIAHYHAAALRRMPLVSLRAVCDVNAARSSDFAVRHGIAGAHDSLEDMLACERLDVVHVLTPPEDHVRAGRLVLEAGAHLFLEKPMCTQTADCDALLELAERRGLRVGSNHNFLFHPAYERLRDDVRSGLLGPLDHVSIVWVLELPQLKSGPFDMWALQEPTHVLLEVGPHAFAQVLDLGLSPEEVSVRPGSPVTLAGGQVFYRRWQISMCCGHTAVDLYFSFAPGFARRTVQVSGLLGTGQADLERNTYVLQRPGRWQQDLGKYELVSAAGRSLVRQAHANLMSYLLSKARRSNAGSAYAASMTASIRSFYEGLRTTLDPRCSGQMGRQVVEQCARVACLADTSCKPAPARARGIYAGPEPDTLVLGGTGFIGRELVRQLLGAGRTVRVMTRGRSAAMFQDHPHVQIVSGDMRGVADLARAIDGVRDVYHLARSPGGSWKEYHEQDVLGTRRLAQCCQTGSVRRLVYVSSIAGYSLSGRAPITEQTPFARSVLEQNKYARAKAQAEEALLDMHARFELPVVIVRPGMVIGRGGELCHGGVGTWNGLGHCTFWGDGHGKLPLVLVEDVARGMIAAMQADGCEGEVFNLVDEPSLSAQEYVCEIERFAGIRIQTRCASPRASYAADLVKWAAKLTLRMPDRYVPTPSMWRARVPVAHFDCAKARDRLGWRPAGDRDTLISRGIHVHLVEFTHLPAGESEESGNLPGDLELEQLSE